MRVPERLPAVDSREVQMRIRDLEMVSTPVENPFRENCGIIAAGLVTAVLAAGVAAGFGALGAYIDYHHRGGADQFHGQSDLEYMATVAKWASLAGGVVAGTAGAIQAKMCPHAYLFCDLTEEEEAVDYVARREFARQHGIDLDALERGDSDSIELSPGRTTSSH